MGVRISADEKLQDRTRQWRVQLVRQRRGPGEQQTAPVLVSRPGDLRQRYEPVVHIDRRWPPEVFLLPKTKLPFLQIPTARAAERAEGTGESKSRAP